MTAVVPLEVGEFLVPKLGKWTGFREVELKARVEFKGSTYWSVAMTSKGGASHLDTLSEGTLREGFVRKPKFYQIGKSYMFQVRNGHQRTDVWKVLDVYAISNPAYGVDKVKAVARMITTDGQEDIQTLSRNDFDRMVEV